MYIEKEPVTSHRVTVDEVKKQLNIEDDFNDDDAFIEGLIESATDFIAGEINADIEITDNTVEIADAEGVIEIPAAPFISMTAQDGVALHRKGWQHFFIKLDAPMEVLTLEFKTGYNVIPPALRQAIILKAAALYDSERSDQVIGTIVAKTGTITSLVRKFYRKYY